MLLESEYEEEALCGTQRMEFDHTPVFGVKLLVEDEKKGEKVDGGFEGYFGAFYNGELICETERENPDDCVRSVKNMLGGRLSHLRRWAKDSITN